MPAAERLQQRGRQRGVIDRRELMSLEPTLQPADRDSRMPLRFFERGQRGELEQVDKSRPWDLNAERRFGHGEIAALDRPLKDRPRYVPAPSTSDFPGAGRCGDVISR